ncbi:MAG TPA: amidohydrolase [Synergistaceae bacterium]|nr:amidohydrolase [Synergistaceae bacterium]HPQ36932.1 amidohydrolase [Synergistaceae bacterium]
MATLLKNMILVDALKGARRGDVLVRNGRISLAGDSSSEEAETCIDGKGHTALLPGFVNSHTHAAMVLLRGLGEDMAVLDWLNQKIWPVENNLNGERVYWGTCQALLEMASTGTTCFGDMYFFMDQVAQASLDMGMRAGLSRGILWDATQEEPPVSVKEQRELAEKWHRKDGLINVLYSPHAPYTVSPEHLEFLAREAGEKGLGVHVHWLESAWEREFMEKELRRDPIGFLEETGLMDAPRLLLAHGVWFPEDRVGELARKNVTVLHNPGSNLKLGSGIAPVPAMLEKGVQVALGTDGAASNNRLDLWEEMRMAALLHKGAQKDPLAVSASQALAMATLEGAKALGFSEVGCIEEGWEADLFLVNLDQPHYNGWNEENLVPYIVYAGSSADVEATMVKGRWIWGKYGSSMERENLLSQARRCRKELVEA